MMRILLPNRLKRVINVVARKNKINLRWFIKRRKRQRSLRLNKRLKRRRRKLCLRSRRLLLLRRLPLSLSKLKLRRNRRNKLLRKNLKRKSPLLLPLLRKRSLNLSQRRPQGKRSKLQELREMLAFRRSYSKRRMRFFHLRRLLTTRMLRSMSVMLRSPYLKSRWQNKLKEIL
jgi:hypothetical protein